MTDQATKHMISLYNQEAEPTMFLSGLFQARPQNFHATESVEIDIMRSEEDIAIVVQSLSAGARENSADLFVNKKFTPPIFKESFSVHSEELFNRQPGQDPFNDPNFRANLVFKTFRGMRLVENKIRRSQELQAAQVLQTGVVTLSDETGADLYSLDYKPKTSHFPTAGTTWGQAGAKPLADIAAVAAEIRKDGKTAPNQLIFGDAALREFLADPTVRDELDNRRMDLGDITRASSLMGGATYHGVITIGAYNYEIISYPQFYRDPNGGTLKPYIHTGKVIIRDNRARMDWTFGAIPNIGQALGRQNNIMPELPRRLQNAAGRMDLWTNMWLTNDGDALMAAAGARPLAIPTAIDTYGCLNTGLTA